MNQKPDKFNRKIDPRVGYIYRHYVRTIGESHEYKARRVTAVVGWGCSIQTVTFVERTKHGGEREQVVGIKSFIVWAQDSEVLKYEPSI